MRGLRCHACLISDRNGLFGLFETSRLVPDRDAVRTLTRLSSESSYRDRRCSLNRRTRGVPNRDGVRALRV